MTTEDELLQLFGNSFGIHKIEPVDQQPVTKITRWLLVEVLRSDGSLTRHLVGRAMGEGRVSSAITEIDLERMRLTTKSGRVYVIDGPSGFDGDAQYVFYRWIVNSNSKNARDITAEVFGEPGTA